MQSGEGFTVVERTGRAAAGTTEPPVTFVPVPALEEFGREAMPRMGVRQDDASLWLDSLLSGTLRSLPGQGQGIQRLPVYYDRIKRGVIQVDADLEVISRFGSVAVVDAHDGIGPVMAARAMDMATDMADKSGIGAVGVRHGTHFGVAAYYSSRAARRGFIGVVFSNAAPEIAPWGGSKATVGTNPWSVAIPTSFAWPIVLDMANSTSGKGMIDWYRREGRPIPADWALTASGARTTDPVEGMSGTLFPVGGPKGYAMAVIVDAITGVLTGASFGLQCSGASRQDLGHLMLSINVRAFMEPAVYESRLEQLIAEIRASPLAEGSESILLPGELEYGRECERRANGAPISDVELAALHTLGRELTLKTMLPEPGHSH
jgi:LDH2 family malate/lactate/ureidoglycolate dehydrogenase